MQRPGRPRQSRIDRALHDAVHQLVSEIGYPGVTVDAVATRAGVSKAAIYRRHATKTDLVFGALFEDFTEVHLPDTGSLAGDLTVAATELFTAFTRPAAAAAIPALFADAMNKDGPSARLRSAIIASGQADFHALLDRAVARGEVAGSRADADGVHVTLLGTIFAWLFLLQWEPDPALPRRVAEQVARSLTA